MNKDFAIFFHTYSYKIFFWLFLATFFLQFLFWQKTNQVKPQYDLIPKAPNQYLVKAYSLGDPQFLYRVLLMKIQNAGDVFAGFTALKYYDYDRLYDWLLVLDGLDSKTNLTPALASYIYGSTKNHDDVKIIIKYLQQHAVKDLNHKWWWIFQAIYLSSNVVNDEKKSLELAKILSKTENENAPLWTKQMPAFIYAKYGNGCAAFKIIKDIIDESNSKQTKVTVEEMNFMRYFINERLRRLKAQKFNPKNCKNNE